MVSFACLITSLSPSQQAMNNKGEQKRTFFISEGDHNTHRPEYLLFHNPHVRVSVCEDGGLHKVSFLAVPLTAKVDSRTVFLAALDVIHNSLSMIRRQFTLNQERKDATHIKLKLGHLWALDCVRIKWVSNLDLLGLFGKLGDKRIVDGGLHEDA